MFQFESVDNIIYNLFMPFSDALPVVDVVFEVHWRSVAKAVTCQHRR
jgi:hypothetical protein